MMVQHFLNVRLWAVPFPIDIDFIDQYIHIWPRLYSIGLHIPDSALPHYLTVRNDSLYPLLRVAVFSAALSSRLSLADFFFSE